MTFSEKQPAGDKLPVKVSILAELVQYQAGSVVSRTIAERQGGTVTLFAFDEGQGLSEHTAPFEALVYVMDGKTKITISGKPFEITTGQMIILPANQPHSLQAISRFKMMLTMLKA